MIKTGIKILKTFSIELLVNERLLALSSGVVKTGQIFQGSEFTEDGLFSTKIFGDVGSKERMRLNGRIELNTQILHPLVWIGITSMSSLHKRILTSQAKAKWDSTIGDFVESEDGSTGFNFFIDKLDKIKFTNPNNSDLREFKIKLTQISDKSLLLLDNAIVLAAGLRDYSIDKNGKPSQDEVNDYYRSIINTSAMISDNDPTTYNAYTDALRIKLQEAVVKIYLHSLSILTGKRGLVQAHMMSKTVRYATRNVITADNSIIGELGKGNHLRFNSMSVGLYQYAKAINPIALYRITNIFNKIFHIDKTVSVFDMSTMTSERIKVDNKTYDTYTTAKGLNSYLNKFADNEFAKQAVGSNKYPYILILDKDNVITLIYTLDNIDKEEYKYLRPATNMEVLFIALAPEYDKYYATTSRYPVVSQGGTFPVMPNIKPTINMREVTVDDGIVSTVVNNYPDMASYIYDSLSPHHSRLGRSNADYDGDFQLDAV